MEDQFIALHGSRKRRAEKGFPWKADKEKPSEITVVRFKMPQFQRRDGSLSEGPRIVDARKQPWDGAAIGNGSKVIVAFDIYDWDGENGCGMTFQPRAVQVVEFVPYEQVDPTDGFEEVEGYTTTGVVSVIGQPVWPTTARSCSDAARSSRHQNRRPGAAAPQRPGPQLPAFCRTRRPTTVTVTACSLIDLRLLVLLGLAFQLSTLLLVLAGPVPPRPMASTNTVFRPDAGTDAGEASTVTPLSDR